MCNSSTCASGTNYLTFQGLTFVGDNFTTTSGGYTSRDGQPYITAAVSFVNTQGIAITYSTIAHTSGWGLEFTNNCTPYQTACSPTTMTNVSANNILTNSALYDIGASGLRLGRYLPNADDSISNSTTNATHGTVVSNNIFYGTGRIYPNGEDGCIWIGSSWGNTIQNNECVDSYGGGVAVGPSVIFTTDFEFGNTIQFNKFHEIGEGVISDFGCVHFATGGGLNVPGYTMGDKFNNNICANITHNLYDGGNGGTGIYIDNNSQNVTAAYNLVYRTSGALFFNNTSPNCVGSCNNNVLNNIVALSHQGSIKRGGNPAGGSQDFTFQQNVVYFGQYSKTSDGPQWLIRPEQVRRITGGGTAIPHLEGFLAQSILTS